MRQLPQSGFCGGGAIPSSSCGTSGVGTSCVSEAPQDGTPYNRQDGNWVAAASGGVEEAPEDGTPYARQDATWVALAGGGDMLKATYDVDNDGIVDEAEHATSLTLTCLDDASTHVIRLRLDQGNYVLEVVQ